MREETALEILRIARTQQPGMAARTYEAILQEADAYKDWLVSNVSVSGRPRLIVDNGRKIGKNKKKKSYYKPTGNPPGRPRKDGRPAGSVKSDSVSVKAA